MKFKRIIDAAYPHEYDSWSSEGSSWVIQDLRPEDNEAAVKILVDHLCTDETLCGIQKLSEDPASIHHMAEFWREVLGQQMSLGCYEVKDGRKNLVALNVCIVVGADEDQNEEMKGEKWKAVYDALMYIERKVDAYEYLGLEVLLHGMGLVVKRDYRGAKLGRRILAAREPLSKTQGIKGTATVFTGIASQKSAAGSGFQTIAEILIKELAEAGLPYPRDDSRTLKYMVKKFL